MPVTATIHAVVFDIGNVLLEWQPERFYDAAIGKERRRAMFAAIDLHGMNDGVDRGDHFGDAVAALAGRHPDWRAEITMWHDNWADMAAPEIPHSVRLLRALRADGVPCIALSNFGIQTFEIAQKRYPFLHEFDQRYISGHMGVIKPDPEIYRRLEEGCGFAPGKLLFADDRIDNIRAASTRGWQTHLFDGPAGFAGRLVGEGLLTPEQAA
ncbi:2-haloacid dehalogenase [Loktanella fryxellensis]|uniref:2-haloacid dehalogenase n=1 Tax=Loktanella fryxellensis TaxID=245187 RepID=A0A1H8FP17_9RHOB|nr:HAD family phosphatase [Loktanella fryxellensis]SEN33443.1 2-haloacid dehalogenase [Loktanella fryxellensis]